MCFAYGPAVGGGQLAGTAATNAGVAPILAQIAFLALGLVRNNISPIAAVQLSGLAISLLGLVTGAALPASKPKVIRFLNYFFHALIYLFGRFQNSSNCTLIIDCVIFFTASNIQTRFIRGTTFCCTCIKKKIRSSQSRRNSISFYIYSEFAEYKNLYYKLLQSRKSEIISELWSRTN